MSQTADTPVPSSPLNATEVVRILVVDDEQYMCDVCARALRRSSYEVFATTDTAVALRQLRGERPYDLLLTDIKMPTMSGLELARQAREVDPAIAIIIMTGHASMDNLLQAVQRGAAEFLYKPFELEYLRLTVDQALHKRLLLQDSLRLRSIEHLLQSSEAINATLDRDQLTQIVLETALQHTGCRAGFLLLHDSPWRPKEVLSVNGHTALLDAGRVLANQAYSSGQSGLSRGEAPLCTSEGQAISRGLATPLRAQGEVVGVLLLCDDRPDVLRATVQESVALLANQAGTALRNAALYGQVQETNQRLQELDRLKGEFISIASHELRTPLSIVLGYTMMVRDKVKDEQQVFLQRVMEGAQRIKDIIDDMVNLRHLETGEATLHRQSVELQSIISHAVERMLPMAEAKTQRLDASVPSEKIIFSADREKVQLVLGNLISNAIKFTPDNGAIQVRGDLWQRRNALGDGISSVLVSIQSSDSQIPEALDRGEWIVVQVSDTGIGIPQREQARIFERFYQTAETLTREQGGIGLGLAIVRELVTLQGGLVWVTSSETEGSIFSFAIPYISVFEGTDQQL